VSLRIALDCDGVVADFVPAFLETGRRIGAFPKNVVVDPSLVTSWDWGPYGQYAGPIWDHIMREPYSVWRGLDVLEPPPFDPIAYVSARSIPLSVTEDWIWEKGLRRAPVFHVERGASKVETLRKIGTDVYVDDFLGNFEEINAGGIPCLLMDASHNQHLDVGEYRVHSLYEVETRAREIGGEPHKLK
jgi:hypothetical protein